MSTVVARALGAAAVLGLAFVAWQVAAVILLVLGAAAISTALRQLSERVAGSRLPRRLATALVLVGVLGGFVVIVALATSAISAELPALLQELGAAYGRARTQLSTHHAPLIRLIADQLPQQGPLAAAVDAALAPSAGLLGALAALGWLLVLVLFWTHGGARVEAVAVSLVPRPARARVDRVWHAVLGATGRAVGAQAASTLLFFGALLVILGALRVPFTPVVAALGAAAWLVPFAGGAVAVAICAACAAIAGPWQAAAAALAATLAALVLRRFVEERVAARVHPFVLALCACALVLLLGLGGAVLAPALTAALTAGAVAGWTRHEDCTVTDEEVQTWVSS